MCFAGRLLHETPYWHSRDCAGRSQALPPFFWVQRDRRAVLRDNRQHWVLWYLPGSRADLSTTYVTLATSFYSVIGSIRVYKTRACKSVVWLTKVHIVIEKCFNGPQVQNTEMHFYKNVLLVWISSPNFCTFSLHYLIFCYPSLDLHISVSVDECLYVECLMIIDALYRSCPFRV